MIPTVLLLASPIGLAVVSALTTLAVTAVILQRREIPVRRNGPEGRR